MVLDIIIITLFFWWNIIMINDSGHCLFEEQTDAFAKSGKILLCGM